MIAPLIRALGGTVSIVPSWSQASLTLSDDPVGQNREHLQLFSDRWAAVSGEEAPFGAQLTAGELARLPLVAVTQKEHDAWRLILGDKRPSRLMRANRQEADRAVRAGQALGIASTMLLNAGLSPDLKPVSRDSFPSGTGLWASLDRTAPAARHGRALASSLRDIFAK